MSNEPIRYFGNPNPVGHDCQPLAVDAIVTVTDAVISVETEVRIMILNEDVWVPPVTYIVA